METLITITNFLIFGLIIIAPILILISLKRLNAKRTALVYTLTSFSVLGLLILIFAWWSHESDLLLLEHYGYNNDGIFETEFYRDVSAENMEQVKKLETSMMGIGWPFKAMFGLVMIIPYLIVVYIGKMVMDRLKN